MYATWVEDPLNRSTSENILINFLPYITEEIINMLLTQICGAVEPIGGENTHLKVQNLACGVWGMEGVDEGGAVVPLEVVGDEVVELILENVEVALLQHPLMITLIKLFFCSGHCCCAVFP